MHHVSAVINVNPINLSRLGETQHRMEKSKPCCRYSPCLFGLSPMGMSSVKQDVWFGWNVKNFAQNLLISPRSTQKGRGDLLTVNSRGCHL